MKIYGTRHGVILDVSVRPRSQEFKILADKDGILVFCREKPVKGKVNGELIKEFSKLFHKEVELISGFTSKQKRLLIKDAGIKDVQQLLRMSTR